jgi:uncharacterized protein YfaS (alpha-2-macroglobulin family)
MRSLFILLLPLLMLADTPHVQRITPSGEHADHTISQVVIQFSRAMVPVGNMARTADEVPITITPSLGCEWRWLNTSALACMLRENEGLKPSTGYRVVVSASMQANDGARIEKTYEHRFTTRRPTLEYAYFNYWITPVRPLYALRFSHPVTKASVERSVSFLGLHDYKKTVLKAVDYEALRNDNTRYLHFIGTGEDPLSTTLKADHAARYWYVTTAEPLAADKKFAILEGAGLRTPGGELAGNRNKVHGSFATFGDFRYIGIRCMDESGAYVTLYPGDDQSRCKPMRRIGLEFSAPVDPLMIKSHATMQPPLDGGLKGFDPWANVSRYDQRRSSRYREDSTHTVWLPTNLKGFETYRIALDGAQLTDVFGRALSEERNVTLLTAHRDPKLYIPYTHAVLEQGIDSDIPMYVTNLESVTFMASRYPGDSPAPKPYQIPLQPIEDVAYKTPMGLRSIVGDKSGVVFGTLTSSPGPEKQRGHRLFAQITPYQVHVKLGHFNTAVWVTGFADGKGVTDANVSVCRGEFEDWQKQCTAYGVTDSEGMLFAPGVKTLDPELAVLDGWKNGKLFVLVEKAGDMALVPLTYDYEVNANGAYSYMQKRGSHDEAWGTTAQGVYKLGDTVEFKLYLREHDKLSWTVPEGVEGLQTLNGFHQYGNAYRYTQEHNRTKPFEIEVYDPNDKVVASWKEQNLSAFGAFDGRFTIPKSGAVGHYYISIKDTLSDRTFYSAASFLVSDFTPAPFRVENEIRGERFHAGQEVEIETTATLHSGGAYTDAEARLVVRLVPRDFRPKTKIAKGFYFGTQDDERMLHLHDRVMTLDGNGSSLAHFDLPKPNIYYGAIIAESSVRDERGKYIAATASRPYSGRDRFIGLRKNSWLFNVDKEAVLELLVLDGAQNVIKGSGVTLSVERETYKSTRVKGPGNAYLNETIIAWEKVDEQNLTSTEGVSEYRFTPKQPGYYRYRASVKDTQGQLHETVMDGWVSGPGYLSWAQSDDATLKMVPEQESYKVGDTARYLVKNPFPGAKALVTVERYGVLDSWVVELDDSTAIVEVPIKKAYLPGFYCSVTVISPRVAKPIKGVVDLGKPSYRMGYVQTMVHDPIKQLDVTVKPAAAIYKPGEKVTVDLQVTPRDPGNNESVELVVAVVDEAVLALNGEGKSYYDPAKGFNRLDGIDLQNYSLLSRLIGRQKFEKKGANRGGDGGDDLFTEIRDNFKYVSYWNPSLIPDATGKASFEFETPDNLTGWRIFAMAVTPSDHFGLGDANIKVNRPTEIRPVMPNQVLEGDRFTASFSVMNRTDKPRTIHMAIHAEGAVEGGKRLKYDKFEVAPYARKKLGIDLEAQHAGTVRFTVKAGDRDDADGIEHELTVLPHRVVDVAADYGSSTETLTTKVAIPENIHTDTGGIELTLSSTVVGNVDGAIEYLRDYPYACWEQRLSKALGAASYITLQAYMNPDMQWEGATTLPERTLEQMADFQAPNGGMTYWQPQNAYVSDYLSAYTLLGSAWLHKQGYTLNVNHDKLMEYVNALLRRSLTDRAYPEDMASSLHAVALNAMAQSGHTTPPDIWRFEPSLRSMDLFAKANFLQAALHTKGVDTTTHKKIIDDILGHAVQSGGKFHFNEGVESGRFAAMLASSRRSECAVLSAFVKASKEPLLASRIGDIPFKLMRSVVDARGSSAQWGSTQENLFCLNAIREYAEHFETAVPTMELHATLDAKTVLQGRFNALRSPSLTGQRAFTKESVGKQHTVKIDKRGAGRYYYALKMRYATKGDDQPDVNAGFDVRREYSVERDGRFELIASPAQLRQGEIVRVDLFISTAADRDFVVIDDPVPGALEPVNTDLATASVLDAQKAQIDRSRSSRYYDYDDWVGFGRYYYSFYHKELRHESTRFYSDHLPAGNYHLSYMTQVIAPGEYHAMPTVAKEMYDEDVYGRSRPATLQVTP